MVRRLEGSLALAGDPDVLEHARVIGLGLASKRVTHTAQDQTDEGHNQSSLHENASNSVKTVSLLQFRRVMSIGDTCCAPATLSACNMLNARFTLSACSAPRWKESRA